MKLVLSQEKYTKYVIKINLRWVSFSERVTSYKDNKNIDLSLTLAILQVLTKVAFWQENQALGYYSMKFRHSLDISLFS